MILENSLKLELDILFPKITHVRHPATATFQIFMAASSEPVANSPVSNAATAHTPCPRACPSSLRSRLQEASDGCQIITQLGEFHVTFCCGVLEPLAPPDSQHLSIDTLANRNAELHPSAASPVTMLGCPASVAMHCNI